ncbi:MAG: hypothetical protein DMD81_05065 [Candidatus Rokuibacteriota bacterium]|nr:MAG: hypothetical protein DMD81_05065 [Candidatus Rokubacteria bacterium]
MREDECQPRVAKSELPHDQVERAHRGDLWKGGAADDGEQQQRLARHGQPRDGVGGGNAEHQRERRGQPGDAEAVHERPRQEALSEHDAIVLEGQA